MPGRWVIFLCVNCSSRVRTVSLFWLGADANFYMSRCMYTELCMSPQELLRTGQTEFVWSWGEASEAQTQIILSRLALSVCLFCKHAEWGVGTSSLPTSCFWDSVAASGSIRGFNDEPYCFHCDPEGKPQNKKSIWQACSYVLVCHQ